ncbi:MAG: AMP-binding enzyme, partial [Actinomycetota bacterium]
RHTSVRDVAVVGVPDPEWGQEIVAVVVPEDGASVEEQTLRDWVRAALRGSLTPKEIHFTPELPYTPTGKLKRAQVLEELDPA